MSKTGNKITFNMVNNVIDIPDKEVLKCRIGEEEYDVEVKTFLNLKEAYNFCGSVAATCANYEETMYAPYAWDFAVRVNTLISYAGFNTPKDYAKAYRVVYLTDIYDKIVEIVIKYSRQYHDLIESARALVRYDRDSMVASVSSGVKMLIDKMAESMEASAEAMKGMNTEELKASIDKIAPLLDKEKLGTGVVEFPVTTDGGDE